MRRTAITLSTVVLVLVGCGGSGPERTLLVSVAGVDSELYERYSNAILSLDDANLRVVRNNEVETLEDARTWVDSGWTDVVVLRVQGVEYATDWLVGPRQPGRFDIVRPEPLGFVYTPAWSNALWFRSSEFDPSKLAALVFGIVRSIRRDMLGAADEWASFDEPWIRTARANAMLCSWGVSTDTIRATLDSVPNQDNGSVLIARGLLCLREGNRAEARRYFEDAVFDSSTALLARNNLAALDAESGRPDDARPVLDSLVVVDSTFIPAFINRAWLELSSGNTARAILLFEGAAERFPDRHEILVRLAHACYVAGNEGLAVGGRTIPHFRAGRRALNRALESAPNDPELLTDVGWVLHRNEQPGEAVSYFGRALAVDSTYAEVYARWGMSLVLQALLEQYDPDQQAELYDRADSVFVVAQKKGELDAAAVLSWSDGLYKLGVLLEQRELLAAADVKFRRAVEVNPSHDRAVYGVGRVLLRLAREQDAVSWFARSDSLLREDWKSYLWGVAEYRLGHRSRADRLFERGERSPDVRGECMIGRSVVARDLGRSDDVFLSRAREVHPDSAEYLFHLARVHDDMSHLDDARLYYADAVEVDPNFAQAHYYYARLLEEVGRTEESFVAYRRFLETSRGEFPVAEQIVRNRLKQGGVNE
jgi:tetratricopeptide (TPR) repeat protein